MSNQHKKIAARWAGGTAFLLCVLALAALLASDTIQKPEHLWLDTTMNGGTLTLEDAYDYSGPLTLTVVLPEWNSRWRPLLELNCTKAADVRLDGKPLGRTQTWDGRTLGNAFFTLPLDCAGKTVTVETNKDAAQSAPFLYLTDMEAMNQAVRTDTAKAAFPAAAFGMVSLFTLGLFFYGWTEGHHAWAMLLLSLAALGQTFYFHLAVRSPHTIPPQLYGLGLFVSRAALFSFPSLYLLSGMKKQRKLFFPFAVLPALLYFVIAGFQTIIPAFSTAAARIGELFYLTAAALLVCAIREYRNKNPLFRLFLPALLLSAAAVAAAYLLSALHTGSLRDYLDFLAVLIREHQPEHPLFWWNVLLLSLCCLASVLTQLKRMAKQKAQVQILSLQESLAKEQLAAVQESAASLRKMRHDTVNHYTVLQNLSQAGEWDSLKQYLNELLTQSQSIPALAYTPHPAVNAVLTVFLARAHKQGINVSCQADIPQTLPFLDTDLCTILMNLLQNALEANALAPPGAEKRLRAELRIRDAHLYIGIENTRFASVDFDSKAGLCRTTKPDQAAHGYGLRAVQSIARKYQSELLIEYPDGLFFAATALQMPKTSPK
ncbi:MAG: GHKL domain-containing protein [Eubacterium sp.]|nr:GHKL domain-containing protein [Eubacterium sp.]